MNKIKTKNKIKTNKVTYLAAAVLATASLLTVNTNNAKADTVKSDSQTDNSQVLTNQVTENDVSSAQKKANDLQQIANDKHEGNTAKSDTGNVAKPDTKKKLVKKGKTAKSDTGNVAKPDTDKHEGNTTKPNTGNVAKPDTDKHEGNTTKPNTGNVAKPDTDKHEGNTTKPNTGNVAKPDTDKHEGNTAKSDTGNTAINEQDSATSFDGDLADAVTKKVTPIKTTTNTIKTVKHSVLMRKNRAFYLRNGKTVLKFKSYKQVTIYLLKHKINTEVRSNTVIKLAKNARFYTKSGRRTLHLIKRGKKLHISEFVMIKGHLYAHLAHRKFYIRATRLF